MRGAAYVFVGSGFSWNQQAKLIADDRASEDRFGYSVAVVGNRAVVGAYLADPFSISNAGAAYVFARTRKHLDRDAEAHGKRRRGK